MKRTIAAFLGLSLLAVVVVAQTFKVTDETTKRIEPVLGTNQCPHMVVYDHAGNSRGVNVTAAFEMSVLDSNSAAILVDTTAMAASLVSIDTDTTTIAADTTSIDADTTTIAADTTSIDADTTSILADTTAILADTTAILADTTSIDTDTTTIAADTTSIDADTTTIAGDTTSIDAKLTSDNDAKELADYYDSTSQLSPFYVDDASLGQDSEPFADVLAEIYDLLDAVRTLATQSIRTNPINPASEWYNHFPIADVTNGDDTPSPYLYHFTMNGKSNMGLQFIFDGGSGSVTMTIFCTYEGNCAPADCAYFDIGLSVFGAASWTASDDLTDNDGKLAMCNWVRLSVTAATGDADDADWWITGVHQY